MKQFVDYIDSGIITFTHLCDEQNAVFLCVLCHRNFDDLARPASSFSLLTSNTSSSMRKATLIKSATSSIRLLTPHEKSARLISGAEPGRRSTPTAEQYIYHQKRYGHISPDATGGIYWRYTLRDYLQVLPITISSSHRDCLPVLLSNSHSCS